MRLLNTTTGKLELFSDPTKVPAYAILSHVWQQPEQTYEHVQGFADHRDPLSRLSDKIRKACIFARSEGFEWIWIDTCCIDKSSSSELSEAINSMYAWYSRADICYVWLHDVEDAHPSRDRAPGSFRSSVWHSRGWTLQELIAPRYVVFLSREWHTMGTKQSLAPLLETITGIDRQLLQHHNLESLHQLSVAKRMSWAARRTTTREEDRAHSLMGIFNVRMSTIYGEGRHAFTRLQYEILKQTPDQTLFAWGAASITYDLFCTSAPCLVQRDLEVLDSGPRSLLASSPSDFEHSSDITTITLEHLAALIRNPVLLPPEYVHTGYGMRTNLPLLEMFHSAFRDPIVRLAVLACVDGDHNLIMLFLHQNLRTRHQYYAYDVGMDLSLPRNVVTGKSSNSSYYRLCKIPSNFMEWPRPFQWQIQQLPLYINYRLLPARIPPRKSSPSQASPHRDNNESYAFFFPDWVFQWANLLVVNVGEPPEARRRGDGYLLELVPDHPTLSHRTLMFVQNRDDTRSASAAGPQGFRLSIARKCKCSGDPLMHPVSFSVDMINEHTPDPSPPGSWPTRRRGSLSRLMDHDDSFVHMMLKTPSTPSPGPWEALPFHEQSNSSHDLFPNRQPASSPQYEPGPKPAWQCANKRAHFPVGDSYKLLTFLSEVGKVDITLKQWEGCRRSQATYVFLVDVKVTGYVLGPEMERVGALRKESLDSYVQDVIPKSGLITYRADGAILDPLDLTSFQSPRGLDEISQSPDDDSEGSIASSIPHIEVIEPGYDGPELNSDISPLSNPMDLMTEPPSPTANFPEHAHERSDRPALGHVRRYSSPNLEAPHSPATTYYSFTGGTSSPAPRSRHGSISDTHSPRLSPSFDWTQDHFLSPHRSTARLSSPGPELSFNPRSAYASLYSSPQLSHSSLSPQNSYYSMSPQQPPSPLHLHGFEFAYPSHDSGLPQSLASPRPLTSPLPSVDGHDLPPINTPPPPPRPGISPLPSPSTSERPLDRRPMYEHSVPLSIPPPPDGSRVHAPRPSRASGSHKKDTSNALQLTAGFRSDGQS